MHSSVEADKLLQTLIRIVQDFLGRSHPLCPGWLWYQEVSSEFEDSHFELTLKYFALL